MTGDGPHEDLKRQPEPATLRSRQQARNRVLGLILGALAVLFFAITIVKLGLQGSGG